MLLNFKRKQLLSLCSRAHARQQKQLHSEKPAHRNWRVAPAGHNQRKPLGVAGTPATGEISN